MLLKRLAVGGMAELYLAKDSKKDRLVVIKRILPYLAQEREFVQMFLDEARIASQLHHPNIITVYELGHLEGSIFIAMEYVEGVDLRKIFNEEQKRASVVPPNITAWLTARLCDGLHYAHNRVGADGKPLQIIHRDVSPQNLMVGYNGSVKLVDFGIAKAGALMERSKPGVIKGKFLYLSPEQLSQERIDHRADIFALGTMMYEICSGRSPFYKATTEAVIYAIRAEDPPPPHLSRRDFPMGLSKVIMKCLVKDRTKRYQQAGEVKADLEAWMKAEARTTLEDVKAYVARLFGGDEERTSLFIPANARGPNDRMTDRLAKMVGTGADSKSGVTDPELTERGAAVATAEETTKPLAPTLGDGVVTASMVTAQSVITAPIGRRPTPEPMRAMAPPKAAPVAAPARPRNPAAAMSSAQPEPRTQTARPQDLAKAFVAPPVRRPSGEAMHAAGDGDDATALAAPGRSSGPVSSDSLSALTPSFGTPVTAENRPRPAAVGKVPEGMRETLQPPDAQGKRPVRGENGVSNRSLPQAGAPRPSLANSPKAPAPGAPRASVGSVRAEPAPRAATGAIPARAEVQAPRAATATVPARAESPAPRAPAGAAPVRPEAGGGRPATQTVPVRGESRAAPRASTGAPPRAAATAVPARGTPSARAGMDGPQPQPAGAARRPTRAEVHSEPPVPVLPPEPPTKGDRPQRLSSSDDLGLILDEALPPDSDPVVGIPLDPADEENTLDLKGKGVSKLGDSQDASAEVPRPTQQPALDDDDVSAGLADRPWLVAALVFVVVLVVGLGSLAIYRSRQAKGSAPKVEVTKPSPAAEPKAEPKPEPVAENGGGTAVAEVAPPAPSPDVDATETVLVKIVAPAGTRLIDQRDGAALAPNTPYRWHPGRRPIQYRCPRKGRLQSPDVMYNLEVKSGAPEQSFTISCR